MVFSLYVCDIPKNINKSEIETVFREFTGYIETRMKVFPDKGKICFLDFEKESDAKFVIETLQGFKFSKEDKGIYIKFADSSKGEGGSKLKVEKDRSTSIRKRRRSRSKDRSRSRERERSRDRSRDRKRERSRDKDYRRTDGYTDLYKNNLGPSLNNYDPNLLNLVSNIINPNQNNFNLPIIPNNPHLTNPHITNPDNLKGLLFNLINPMSMPSEHKEDKSDLKHKLRRIEDKFIDSMNGFPKNATNIVYIEGLPLNATEREVSHMLRPFPGYITTRLIERDKNNQKSVLCFADFENVEQATACIHTLQGYRFDKNDLVGLHFSYGVNKHNNNHSHSHQERNHNHGHERNHSHSYRNNLTNYS